jgi:hypothetical protein
MINKVLQDYDVKTSELKKKFNPNMNKYLNLLLSMQDEEFVLIILYKEPYERKLKCYWILISIQGNNRKNRMILY